MIVLIVTPTRNAEEFLDETILSIVSQVGDFDLYYHIQDSESTDSTLEIVKKWQRILSNPDNTFFRSRIFLSWASESDSGLYDAINRGVAYLFSKIGSAHPEQVAMTWINGDDLLAQGSLQTVVEFFSHNQYDWLTGVPSLIRHDSVHMDLRDAPWGFSRYFLKKGIYDGRRQEFVQQEGTFWRQSLWQAVGGLDASLRLVGDWDLWRRFAEHADLVTLRAVLAAHRRRKGQLSSDLRAYHHEIDDVLARNSTTSTSKNYLEDRHFVLTGRWNTVISRWQIDKYEVLESSGLNNSFLLPPKFTSRLSHQRTLRSNLSSSLDILASALSKAKSLNVDKNQL